METQTLKRYMLLVLVLFYWKDFDANTIILVLNRLWYKSRDIVGKLMILTDPTNLNQGGEKQKSIYKWIIRIFGGKWR
jgi:hypothetical protein